MNSLANLPSERQCHKILFKIVWGTSHCPDCEHRLLYRGNYAWCGKCRKKHSVRSVTWFHHSKLSFQKIWLLIWCWQKKKSIGSTKDIVGTSYPTIRRWFRSFRIVLPHSKIALCGDIECDESFFGRRKYGHQTMVIGAIERHGRKIKLAVIKDRDKTTLEDFIETSIDIGSRVTTDAWFAYNEIDLLGYEHDYCNHSKGHFGPTNNIENLWSVIKRHIRSLYNNLSIRDLTEILKEWENRQNNPELFYTVDNYLKVTVCSRLVH